MHIPGLKRNLLSVGQMDEEGYFVIFGGGAWKITKGSMVIARGKMEGTLYSIGSFSDCIAVAREYSNADLWHCRLGHMSEKGMKVLCSKGLLPGLKSAEIGLCEDWIFGKQKRVTFLINRGPSTPLENGIHVEVWSGKQVNMSFLRVFGCDSYVHCSR
ncbi:hypothetical protein V2J09_006793 [Rumex salicifolius]